MSYVLHFTNGCAMLVGYLGMSLAFLFMLSWAIQCIIDWLNGYRP